jgi:hypothetical protein
MKKFLVIALLAIMTVVSMPQAEARGGNTGAAIAGGIIGGLIVGGIIAGSQRPPPPQRLVCEFQNKFGTPFYARGFDYEHTAHRAYAKCRERFRTCYDMGCRAY